MDFFGPLPFTQAATISDDPEDPLPGGGRGLLAAGAERRGERDLNRDAELLMELVSFAPTPEAARSIRAHIAAMAEALGPDLTGGVYMNFMEGREAQARVADAFSPEAFRRLQALKAVWDPDDRFRYAFAIPPLP